MITASDWRPFEKNTLQGFVDLALEPSGLILRDCTLHKENTSEWVGLPGRAQIDRGGRHRRDPTGKPLYVAIVEIRDRAARDRFQAAALEAIRKLISEAAHE